MKSYLGTDDRLLVIRSIEAIIDKKLDLISLKEIVDMNGISHYQFLIGEYTRGGGYETSLLIAPRRGFLFDKTVQEARDLLESGNKDKLRSIGWFLKDFPEFKEFKGLYPVVNIKSDFGNEVERPKSNTSVKQVTKNEKDPYEGWELTLRDNRYHVNHKRACKFVK